MPLPSNLTAWIEGSIYTFFNDRKGSYELWCEGYADRIQGPGMWTELRYDGPGAEQFTRSEYNIYVDLNFLITSPTKDRLALKRCLGYWANKLETIPVWKYPESPFESVGCLVLHDTKQNGTLKENQFGKIQPGLGLFQCSLEATYCMDLEV